MKILIILTGGMSSDGISSAWLNICNKLNQLKETNNVDIEFLCIDEVSDMDSVKRFQDLGFDIIHVQQRQSSPINYLRNLRKILKSGNYDAIHVNGSSAFMILELLAAKLAKVKSIVVHSHNTTCNNRILHKLLFHPFNLLPTERLACGEDAGKWLYGSRSFEVFHNGIDLARFRYNENTRREYREKLGIGNDVVAFAHVGKFNYQKNHDFIIEIFDEITIKNTNSRLFLFGDGELQDEITRKVKGLNLEDKVIFMGVQQNIHKYLQAMDSMLLPSRFEGLPNVVVEWQAAGLPSLISDSVTEECAVTPLVSFASLNESPSVWAERIISHISTKRDREVESKEACEALEMNGFDINKQATKLIGIYKNELADPI
ncbi:MAG: glycosyltransferase family 1 protein [Muribaculaceae bacterium]|nr:glycosyltransferase family 1 protein [Muribaculaceae bacterium]